MSALEQPCCSHQNAPWLPQHGKGIKYDQYGQMTTRHGHSDSLFGSGADSRKIPIVTVRDGSEERSH